MISILKHAGVKAETLELVKEVVDTCRICRAWKKPGIKSMSHLNQSEAFNERVQVDILYVDEWIIVHLCDECTRFSMAEIINSREPADILQSIRNSWIKYFGVPKLLVSDSEGGLCSEEAGIWAERLHTSFKLLPRGSHATVVERHHETLRQLIHRIAAQCKSENISVSMVDIVADAVITKNSLLTINGVTPYTAVLGYVPNLLGEYERPNISADADNVGGTHSKYASRLREIAIASIIEHSAKERIKRAQSSQTRLASEQLQLQVNDLVDIYRTPRTKDNTGWRGPCRVVSVSEEDGTINVQWGGRIIACRTQDVRKALMYPAFMERSEHTAFEMIRQHASKLRDSCETFCVVQSAKCWQLTEAARKHPLIFQAMLKTAVDMFYIPRCIGGRLGRGTSGTKGLLDTDESVLIWWPVDNTQLYKSMLCHGTLDINLKELFGENWKDVVWIRMFSCFEDQVDNIRRIADDVPHLAADPPGLPPVAAVPMNEDDEQMPAARDDTSIMSRETRIITPMQTDSTNHSHPPYPPHPPQQPNRRQRTPINSDRSRTPIHTNDSTSSQARTPNTTTPVVSTNSSQRATTGTVTPRTLQSPRGDKRTKEQESQQRFKQTKTHDTPSSASTDPMPTPIETQHEPLLPIHDTDNEEEISDIETIFEPETRDELFSNSTWDDKKIPSSTKHVSFLGIRTWDRTVGKRTGDVYL